MVMELVQVRRYEHEAERPVEPRRSHWDEAAGHPVEDWRYEVTNDDTRLGYLAWVDAREESGEYDDE